MSTTGYHIPENSNFHNKQEVCTVDINIAFLARILGPMSHEQHADKICLIQFSYYNKSLAAVLYTLINDHFNSNMNTSSLLTPLISKCVKQHTEFQQSKLASQFQSCKSVTCTQNVQEQQKLIGVMAKFPLKVVCA
jgi:hypothetical protein